MHSRYSMKILSKKEFNRKEKFYLKEIENGKIFVYPTDTIYGIGCDATNSDAIKKIRAIKQRDEKPFSIIAPDKKWIENNCIINPAAKKWINKLPGPYTLILELKNNFLPKEINNGMKTIGIRIPDNWFAKAIEKTKKPFVTTSVNLTGEKPMAKMEDLSNSIKSKVDYLIYEGPKENNPSMIVKLIDDKEEAIKR